MGRKRKPIYLEQVEVTGLADKGKAVGRAEDGRVVFLKDVAPGDVVDVEVRKKRRKYLEGQVTKFHKQSPHRTEPFCAHFEDCGGCSYQHIQYETQVKEKEQRVRDAFERLAKVTPQQFHSILPSDRTQYFRNKLEFAFGNRRWLRADEINSDISNQQDVLGFHKAGVFDKIIDINHCYLQIDPSNDIRNIMRTLAHEQELEFYDFKAHTGFLRNVIVRTSTLGPVMVIVSFAQDDEVRRKAYLQGILERIPQITSLYYCINTKLNDFLYDLDMHLYWGETYLAEQLGEVKYQIGPKSFFQTNPYQAKNLFDIVKRMANLQGVENVYDLYTGIGSIALYLAEYCKQVVGIEEIEAAIVDAKQNATLNDIQNAIFYAGTVRDILGTTFSETHGKPDLVIIDPPRSGMHPKVVKLLLELNCPRLIYVSCNPATQARDVQLLSDMYQVKELQPVDMFPHTHHIETVALLEHH